MVALLYPGQIELNQRFAEALGLPGMPKIKFLSKEMAKKRKNASRALAEPAPPPKGKGRAEEAEESEIEMDSSDEGSDEEDYTPAEVAPAKATEEKVRLSQTSFSLFLTSC